MILTCADYTYIVVITSPMKYLGAVWVVETSLVWSVLFMTVGSSAESHNVTRGHVVFILLFVLQHRRLDIITVPYRELPCALLYFTGSGLFNRSMRCKARHMVWLAAL